MKKNGAGQSLFLALLISMGLFFFVQGKQLIESGASPVIFIAFSAFAGIIGVGVYGLQAIMKQNRRKAMVPIKTKK